MDFERRVERCSHEGGDRTEWQDLHLTLWADSILASVLCWSGLSKLIDLQSFVAVAIDFAILPRKLSRWFAYSLPGTELIIGIAFLAGFGANGAGLVAAVLFTSFALATSTNLIRGRSNISCGCFGTSLNSSALSWGLVGRQTTLILLSLASAAPGVIGEPPQRFHLESRLFLWAAALQILLISGLSSTVYRLRTELLKRIAAGD